MRTLTSFALLAALWCGLFSFTSSAEAQTVTGTLSGATWRRPNGACNGISPEPATTRRYTVYTFWVDTPGTYTATATRTSGGSGVYLDWYQFWMGDPCVNRWFHNGVGAANATTTSQSMTLSSPILGPMYFSVVVSGNDENDNATFSITLTGPQQANITCSMAYGGGFTPAVQTNIASSGGSFSTRFVPPPAAGCSANWTMSGVPAWISGFPTSGSGATTINYTVAANGGAARSATIWANGAFATSFFEVSQSSGSCTYSISPTSSSIAAAGGSGSFTVTTQAGCGWTTSSSAGWLSNVTPSGTGTGTVGFTVAANSGAARSATIQVAGQTHTVNQAQACTVSLTPNSANVDAAAGSGSFTVNTQAGCSWSTSQSGGFLSGVTASGTGSGTVNYSYAANTGAARTATITVTVSGGASASFSLNQANGCTFSISPTSTNASVAGGSGSFTLTASNANCPWTTSGGAPWITGLTGSGTGSGPVSFNVAANDGPARSATISVAGYTHTVTQASGCAVSLSPSSENVGAAGGTRSFNVSTGAGCAWTASESSSFLSGVTASGTGSASVSYSVAANTGPGRSDTITVRAVETGHTSTFTVNQANGCTYTLSQATTNAGAAAGSGSFNVTTDPACPWTASDDASWITGVTASGTGSGTVSFNFAANTGPARSGTITLNGQTHTVHQASGCAIALSPSSATPGAAGGTASFNVSTDPGCAWTVSESASWLTGVTASGTGSGSVSYTVAANDGVARSAPITVTATETGHAATFTVDQGNGCTYSLASSSANASAAGGSATFTLTASNASCPWTAVSGASWLTGVTASGAGSASVAYTVEPNLGPARSGTITAGGQTFTVNQADGCVATLPSSGTSVAVGGETSSFQITMSAPSCPWTASSAAGWLSNITPSGTGSGTVSFTAAANVGPARSATITAGGQTFQVEQGSGCSVSLPVTAAGVVAAGGSSSFVVNTAPGCAYTVSSDAAWLTANVSASGVEYTAEASTAASRVGTITVQSTTTASSAQFQVTQENGCVVMLSSGGATLPAAGQQGRVDVTSGEGCTFEAQADEPWVTDVTVDAQGVSYTVGAHDGPERSAILTVWNPVSGSSAEFAITQSSGCVVSFAPLSPVPAAGGAQSVAITTGAGCGLTVSGGTSWLTNVSLTGATLSFDVAQNDGIAREHTLTVTTPDSGDSEDLVVSQDSGCTIALPLDMASYPLSGGSGEFTVSTGPGCAYEASSDDPWVMDLSVTATGVSYSVPANDGVARTTLITVRAVDTGHSATFAVDQAGAIVTPAIVMQPSDVQVEEGSPFELSVVASGGALSYAWYKDGQAVVGANGMSFGAAMAELDDEGSYYVVVTNAAGSVTSDEARVDVIPRPEPEPMSDGGVPGGGDGGVPGGGDGGVPGVGDGGAGPERGFGVMAGGGCSVAPAADGSRSRHVAWLVSLFVLGLSLRRWRARGRR